MAVPLRSSALYSVGGSSCTLRGGMLLQAARVNAPIALTSVLTVGRCGTRAVRALGFIGSVPWKDAVEGRGKGIGGQRVVAISQPSRAVALSATTRSS